MIKKPRQQPEDEDIESVDNATPTNGNSNAQMMQILQTMAENQQTLLKNQQDLSERMDDIESGRMSGRDSSQVKLVEYTFNTPPNKLIELSNIPTNAPRMLANEITLEHLFHKNVISGKIPLTKIYRETWLQARKGVNGDQLKRAAKIALEQATAVTDDENAARELGAPD